MIFDGPNSLIILEASDGDEIPVVTIYSRWKDWVLSGVGSPWVFAFTANGGQALGGGRFQGDYFFLNTLAGWVIRPREEDHTLTLVGNLYPNNAGDSIFTNTLGSFLVQTRLETSSLTQIAAGGDPTAIAAAVWLAQPEETSVVVFDAGNTASTFVTDLSESVDDYWKDNLVRITSGALIGQVKRVTAYDGTTKAITVGGGFTGIPAAGVTFALLNR